MATKITTDPPTTVTAYKVWIELEAEHDDGEHHNTLDLPFSSTRTFYVSDFNSEREALQAALEYAETVHEAASP